MYKVVSFIQPFQVQQKVDMMYHSDSFLRNANKKADGYQAYHILTQLVIFASCSAPEAVNDVYRELMKAVFQCEFHCTTSNSWSSIQWVLCTQRQWTLVDRFGKIMIKSIHPSINGSIDTSKVHCHSSFWDSRRFGYLSGGEIPGWQRCFFPAPDRGRCGCGVSGLGEEVVTRWKRDLKRCHAQQKGEPTHTGSFGFICCCNIALIFFHP